MRAVEDDINRWKEISYSCEAKHLQLASASFFTAVGETWLSGWASLVAQMVKNLPAMRETEVQSHWED